MAIEGIEWLFIALIVLMFILWAPEKIPKFAQAIAKARREFENAYRELYTELEKEAMNVELYSENSDEKLIEVARSFGIETRGKTREEIMREVKEKTKEIKEGPSVMK